MLTTTERAARRARELLREIQAEKFSRRDLARLGLIAGSAFYFRGASLRQALAASSASPRTTPFEERLPIPEPAEEDSSYPYNEADHQYCSSRFPMKKMYHLRVRERKHRFTKDLRSPVWSYGDNFGGPIIDARYGQPFCLHIENDLPSADKHKGFGHPEIAPHLHNFHTASESDGGPWNWIPPKKNPSGKPNFRNHHYCMARAGFTTTKGIPAKWVDPVNGGDLRETLTTLFLHDHRPEFTASNVYKGLVCMVRMFDDDDTGDETTGWQLPSGDYDVPLILADKKFDPDSGELVFNQFANDGYLGDKLTVNGKVQPFMPVKRRKYRFRILNGGPSRFYRLVLRKDGANQPFHQISESGNLLPRTRKDITSLELWVAERADIIIDFKKFKNGDRVYLANNLVMMEDGRGIDRGKSTHPDSVGNQLLEFRVQGVVEDPSRVPNAFRPLPSVNLNEVVKVREWDFGRKNGMWHINGKLWDPDIDHAPEFLLNPPDKVRRNSAEIWRFRSTSGGWDHPIHVHFEEGIIISENGRQIAPENRYRTDIYRMGGTRRIDEMEVFMRFRDFPDPDYANKSSDNGRYVIHCHNTLHEDHGMMATWNIVP
ncbi:MAG TPA: multicopper oxidase domain-containing protein [Geminicoccus sp.]|uniref:multicopper oxidase family protein n=1 Tax=Geminicoccus sp. TaxID=2024832 RepID=UPI002B5A81C3|nr:multicopper oxidase domain-containing protein [Geminicoccus sp.]HWL68813.1 multicopper oxidase domain-containing protein [Geminicoccus sp.]